MRTIANGMAARGAGIARAWQRSGAVSADSSPPPRAPAAGTGAVTPTDHCAPYSRYRCLAGGPRGLRRQWSLERGDALAAAAGARGAAPAEEARSPPLEPLALLAPPAPRTALARYRTRPDAPPPPTSAQGPSAAAPSTPATEDEQPPPCSP